MSTLGTIIGVVLFLSPIFIIGYRIGYRRGVRQTFHQAIHEPATYDEKHVLIDSLDWRVEIDYVDARRKPSKRQVTVHRVYGSTIQHPTYIEGYCYSRKQPRSFKVANIQQLIDLTTGEVAATPQTAIAKKLEAA